MDVADGRAGPLLVLRERRRFGDVEEVQAVVWDRGLIGRARFGGADVHAAVKLKGIGVDYLAARMTRHCHRQFGLARSRRSDDGDNATPVR